MPRAAETTAERQVRLAEIRRQIQAGTYENPERLSAAIDALLEDFAGGPDGASNPTPDEPESPQANRPRPK